MLTNAVLSEHLAALGQAAAALAKEVGARGEDLPPDPPKARAPAADSGQTG
jgi:hypothetical protein